MQHRLVWEATRGANEERLADVKAHYDPAHLFRSRTPRATVSRHS
ncbi:MULTISPECIES: BBE domain-containing protein [Tessaracoccus]